MRDPKQNGIQSIRIRNFKVFKQPTTFNINGRHTLVYGTNGSGKSSLYWALYTLLQSISKQPNETNKYFQYNGNESLLNIHEAENNSSYIFANAKVNNASHTAMLSPNGVRVDGLVMNRQPYAANWLREADLAAEFINHRQLIGFYNFANSEPINLIWAFENGFYPFLNGITHFRTTTLSEILKSIESRISEISIGSKKAIEKLELGDVRKLNEEYGLLVTFAQANVNRFLHKNFKHKNLTVNLKPTESYKIVKQDKEWALLKPIIKLTVSQKKADGTYHEIDRPQSFLNEALLTRIGVAIRFALLQRRPQTLPLKLMVMDDLLISMDMDNRSDIINLIEKRYVANYQIFIFTHDKALFNLLKRKVEEQINDWAIYEVKDGVFKNAKSELEKAKAFLEQGDFEACALELRKLGEILLRQYLKGIDPTIFNDKKFRSFGTMIEMAYKSLNENTLKQFDDKLIKLELSPEDLALLKQDDFTNFITRPIPQNQKLKILKARTALFEFADNATVKKRKALNFLKQVQHIKDKILNQGAHPTDEVIYRTEMEEAVEIFESFKEALYLNS